MAKNDHERGKGLAIGAAIGAVVGVVTGILFAPKSGKETRQDIKKAAHQASEKILHESKKVQDELSKVIASAENLAKEKGSKIADASKEALTQAKKAKDTVVEKAKELKEGKNSSDADLRSAIVNAKEAQQALVRFLKK